MKVIDLEQHFETELWVEALKNNSEYPKFDAQKGLGYWEDSWIPNTKTGANEKLLDLGEGRLRLMDECGIDYAQLSLTSPGSESFPVEVSKKIAEDANNQAAKAIEQHPDRFGAYMTLAPKDPEWSLKEIDRCLKMGLWGWHTHSNYKDAYLDEKQFWPILERCEELDMPIYIHPAATTAKELRTFGICLAAPTFGFGVDTQYAFLQQSVGDASGEKRFPCSYIAPEEQAQRFFFHFLPMRHIIMGFPDFRVIPLVIGKCVVTQRLVL